MDLIQHILAWFSGPVPALVFAVLFALSESLGAIPQIKANGVFQFFVQILGWIKSLIPGIAPKG